MNARDPGPVKPSFKAQMVAAREEAIVDSAGRLLARKGFEAMTVDDVAADVGIAKASLYKHFTSKEELAAAAVVRVMAGAGAFLDSIDDARAAQDKLRAAVQWLLQAQLAGQLPQLPGRNSSLRACLQAHEGVRQAFAGLADRLDGWIRAAQAAGTLAATLPVEVVRCTLLARAYDPAAEILRAGGGYSDEAIAELVTGACFEGLSPR